VLEGFKAIVEAVCNAWLNLNADRVISLWRYPWIKQVNG